MGELVLKRLDENKRAGEPGFILDGFPRTLGQAETLADSQHSIDLAVNLQLREDVLVEKCMGRYACGD